MGVKFRKSISLGKHAKINIGKKSVGVSLGGKYGGISTNSKTGTRYRTSVPGTGLSYTTGSSKSNGHGCLWWLLIGWWWWMVDLLLWIFLFLPRLLIQIFKKKKYVGSSQTVSQTVNQTVYKSMCNCMSCGYVWEGNRIVRGKTK